MDNATWQFFKNGVGGVVKTLVDTDSGSTASITELYPYVGAYNSDMELNFGQKPFKFAPPEGYKILNYANLPSPGVVRPDSVVGISTWTGDGSTDERTLITNFQPDLIWSKTRTVSAYHNNWFDSVRGFGAQNALVSDETGAAGAANGGRVKSVNGNGITWESGGGAYAAAWYNESKTYVSWYWKAGGNKNTFNVDDVGYASAAAAGLDGGTLDPSGASVNTKSKFGIYTWAGHGSSNETLAHGLGAKPDFMVCKKYSTGGNNWVIWHKSIGVTKYLMFTSAGDATDATLFNSHTNDSDNLWSLGTNNSISDTGQSAVAYLWCDVPGMQKFGSYEGTNATDGTFVELGFRPAIVIFKNIDASEDWMIVDDNRSRYNPVQPTLYPDEPDIESSATNRCDFLSNGFKLRSGTSIPNTANTYIYAAWAHQPMNGFYGAQSNAR